MATLRNLKIKTSTCKRIVKELHSYEKEVEREAAKTADMKAKGADPYDLKQQENVLAESRMMVPDCHKRLEAALSDLKATLGLWAVRMNENLVDGGLAAEDATPALHFHYSILNNPEVELEESGENQGSEITDARNIITEVEQLYQSSED